MKNKITESENEYVGIVASFLQKKTNLPESVTKNIFKDDDWSFLIKLGAVAEKMVENLITCNMEEGPIKDAIIDKTCFQKNKLAGKLKILSKKELDTIELLRMARNEAAHSTYFSFEKTMKGQGFDKFKNKYENIYFEDGKVKDNKKREYIRNNPKKYLFIDVFKILAEKYLSIIGKETLDKDQDENLLFEAYQRLWNAVNGTSSKELFNNKSFFLNKKGDLINKKRNYFNKK